MEQKFKYRFTVFTPTYNSEKFINRVIESLESQQYKDFEWLVVDDASQDNTGKILKEYAARASFPVNIIQKRVNKMVYDSLNLAFAAAKGELMVFAGHDDKFHPETLEVFNDLWNKHGDNKIAGIWCLCQNQHGSLVGKPFPEDFRISNYFEMFEKSIYRQERFACTRTDVLRKNLFDLNNNKTGERFLWEAIGEKYDTIFVNKILRTYYIEPENLHALSKTKRSKNATDIYLYNLLWINTYLVRYNFSFKFKLRYYFALSFYGILSNNSLIDTLNNLHSVKSKVLTLSLYPFALLIKTYMGIRGRL